MKSCPFCNQPPDSVREHGVQIGNSFAVVCRCGAHGPTATTATDAIAAWDIRASEETTNTINTSADFIGTLMQLGQAIEHITLPRLPESCDAMNAATMAETLYYRIKRQELCGNEDAFALAAGETEAQEWGNGQ